MTRLPRWAAPIVSATLALALGACASPNPSPSPTSSEAASPSGSPTTSAGSSPGASVAAGQTARPGVSPAGSPPCGVTPQTGLLPSDRLVDLAVSSTTTNDLVTFVFEPSSAPTPAGPPRGSLEAVKPPFTFAGSGQPIDLLGQRAVQVRFTGMTIATESGEATFRGPDDSRPSLPALREAIQFDASEGVIGWYIGYDGPGCVTLIRSGNEVTVMIARTGAPAG